MPGSSGEDAANRVLAAIGTINFVKEPVMVERYSDAYNTLEEAMIRGVTANRTKDKRPCGKCELAECRCSAGKLLTS
ncbi:hypothetical protein HFO45_17015 [Rhizobium leguminosarum]|uniref:hypothetical protein n=1 Tax=Rhizobium leguminosarum TaxID=384 RepID=UPI001C987ED6|nr:hypothetical protein [Rhizobium leguminosarum]MBY5649948.1 hypothetical protein [Rhizobium leguminosarum]